jgi:hypothetical protein
MIRTSALLVCALAATIHAQTTTPAIRESDLRAHVQYLASDELEGRHAGTEGNRKAAAYIADHFRRYGLEPLGDNGSYFQKFTFVSAVRMGPGNALTTKRFATPDIFLAPDRDFRPLGFSTDGKVTGPVVFAGYGITATEKSYDDYAGIDVTGAVVLVLRHGPDGTDPHSDFARFTSLRNKARTARDHGAAGIIIVPGPADEPDDELIKLAYDQSFASSGIMAVSMTRGAADRILAPLAQSVRSLQDSINQTRTPRSFRLDGVEMTLQSDVQEVIDTTANVVGLLRGGRPEEAVVIGAHFDHLGYGGVGSGSLEPDAHAIHNGADDNASGSAGLLELVEYMSADRARRGRSIVFVAFSAEEVGTLGSQHYVNAPPVPLSSTIAMLNMDMIGRVKDNTLQVHGLGTAAIWPDMVRAANTSGDGAEPFTLKEVEDGVGPSDHAQFYGKDVPVLFFFTGTHEDYHKPSDDADKLTYGDEERVVKMVGRIAAAVAEKPERPVFQKTKSAGPMASGDGRGFRVTLGVIPDYAWSGEGMRVDGIRSEGPAEKAGMKAGDVVVGLAGKKVMNIYDYMGVLGELKSGDEVVVRVRRGEEVLELTAVMKKR